MDKLKTTRQIAKDLGHKKYKVQWPCSLCKGKWRYTTSRLCTTCFRHEKIIKKDVDDRIKKEDTT